ncbi:hypothetical protein STVIR_7723 [Streptomyces viridochromogenes Tue57]|uniref:Integral membrane protein n=1 Tax=Streptomyces viridochromogenes Tue57 TaxID=1160705 RepID=L8P550_STRVR|nr:hypothetical protein STVIR_7723 [Streptomyces viridochromogenes Tue57]
MRALGPAAPLALRLAETGVGVLGAVLAVLFVLPVTTHTVTDAWIQRALRCAHAATAEATARLAGDERADPPRAWPNWSSRWAGYGSGASRRSLAAPTSPPPPSGRWRRIPRRLVCTVWSGPWPSRRNPCARRPQ